MFKMTQKHQLNYAFFWVYLKNKKTRKKKKKAIIKII